MTEAKKDPRRITLGSPASPVRFSYAFVFEPRVNEDKVDKKTGEAERKYTTMVMIPKSDAAAKAMVEKATREAAREKLGDKPYPPTWKIPLRDGDLEWEEKDMEALKGHWFFNCTSKQKPEIVGTERDIEGKLIRLTKDQFKSGDYGRVTVNFYYFENESKGVAVGLGNVQKLKDGEPLGSQRSADDDFGDLSEGFED